MQEKFIAVLPLSPLRSEPSDRAEMVTQMHFGETGTIEAVEKQWIKVKLDADGYTGWADEKSVLIVQDMWRKSITGHRWVMSDPRTIFKAERAGRTVYLRLPVGARIPQLSGRSLTTGIEIPGFTMSLPAEILAENFTAAPVTLVHKARLFEGAPYLWGGKSQWGMDCSGLTQMAYSLCGKTLPRDAADQAKTGQAVNWPDRQKGDLAFFANPEGRVTHTGILTSADTLLHAHGWVREDRLTEEGIINIENGLKTHKLISINRIL